LANWAIELREFYIEFFSRNAIKGQALADFVAEFTNLLDNEDSTRTRTWVIYVDGLSMKKHGRAGIMVITTNAKELCSSLKLEFKTTNNEVEYEAVIVGFGMAIEIGVESVEVQSDS
jgi:hypothetical protein